MHFFDYLKQVVILQLILTDTLFSLVARKTARETSVSNAQQDTRKIEKSSRNCNSHGTQQNACHKLYLTGAHCNSADIRQPDDSRHKG